ncbi:putative RNA-binding protein [Triangularia setosa]|uniref:RNA-binding protein n=1 Tax=Triangularia setosa TaxID=2587417 RepID=A0AAN7A7F6_9PEZI|nr:putative RNA-binding protein [Podospora setosa]
MYEGRYRSRSPSRDGGQSGSYRDREYRRPDDRDGDYRRSRKDSPAPPLRNLNYDDDDQEHYSRQAAPYGQQEGYLDERSRVPVDGGAGRDPSVPGAFAPDRRGRLDGRHHAGGFHSGVDSDRERYLTDKPHGGGHLPPSGSPPADRYARGNLDLDPSSRFARRHMDRDVSQSRSSRDRTASSGRAVGRVHGHGEHGGAGSGFGSSKALILEGLPEDATERDVLYGVDFVTRDHQFSSDQVKLVRLRYDQNGQRIAVVEFHRRSQVEDFLDQFFPEISFPLQHSRGRDSEFFTFGIQDPNHHDDMPDSRESHRGGREDDGWTCLNCHIVNYPHRAVCFKCKTERPEDDGYGGGPLLTGETDECPQQMPSHYVVIRNLDRSVTEEVLAKGVMKLFVENPEPPKEAPTTNKLKSTAPTKSTVGMGAKPGSLRRVFLMRDRRTHESWRYGFAEFAAVEDAMAAIQKFQASTKFTIASKPVVVAFIHTGVFVPAFDPVTPDNQYLSFSPIYNPNVRIKYWNECAFPSVHVVTTEPIPDVSQPDKNSNGNEDLTKNVSKTFKKFKKDQGAAVGAKPIMMPQMELWAKKSAELHGSKARAVDPSISEPESSNLATIREADITEPDGPFAPHWADQYTSYADWEAMTCVVCGWHAPTERSTKERNDLLIHHEGSAHSFYRDSGIRDKAAAALSALGKKHRKIIRRTPRLKSEPLPRYKSFADFDRLRCLLCKRQFRKVEVIWLHEQQSELHKRMLADPDTRSRAEEEFKKLGKKQQSCIPDQAFYREWEAQLQRSQPNYRDRALERRQAFRQPKKPTNQQASTKTSVPEKRKEPASSSAATDTPAKKSKGAGMLAKMGWTAGAGLGAEGAGRTEAIATEVYAPGVGLGAEGSKLGDAGEEAQRRTKGDFSDFVEKTKDRARERFDQLG